MKIRRIYKGQETIFETDLDEKTVDLIIDSDCCPLKIACESCDFNFCDDCYIKFIKIKEN